MSNADSLERLWPVLRDADALFFISCAANTLVFYEHLITLRLEVQQVWKRDISGATVLFVVTRYFLLLNRLFVIIGFYPIQDSGSCGIVLWLQAITSSILITVMSAIAGIRVFALWNRNYRLLLVIVLTGMFPAFANLYFRSASSVYIVPSRFYTCQSAPTAMTAQTYTALSIATRVISIVSDGLVVVLTWVKTYKVYLLTRRARFRAEYSALILRDGTVYFIAVCVLNFVAIMYIMTTGTNLLNDLIVTLSAILMARFLLNLRDQRSHLEDFSTLGTVTKISVSSPPSLRFAVQSGVFTTMGGTVSTGSGEDLDDVEDGNEDEDDMDDGASEESTCVDPHEDHHDKKGSLDAWV